MEKKKKKFVGVENALQLLGNESLTFFQFRKKISEEFEIKNLAAELLIDQMLRKNMIEIKLQGSQTIYTAVKAVE